MIIQTCHMKVNVFVQKEHFTNEKWTSVNNFNAKKEMSFKHESVNINQVLLIYCIFVYFFLHIKIKYTDKDNHIEMKFYIIKFMR